MTLEDQFQKPPVDNSRTPQELIKEVYSKENIALRTNLKRRQIAKIVRLKIFAQKHNSEVALYIYNEIVEHLVSVSEGLEGLGRQDMREALRAYIRDLMLPNEEVRSRRSFIDRMTGR
jgi:hypothetical protein